MNIYLLSNDINMTDAWNEAFPRNINTDEVSVEIVCDSFSNFMHTLEYRLCCFTRKFIWNYGWWI